MDQTTIDGGKVCRKCGAQKALADFYTRQSACKECVKARAADYARNNPEKVAACNAAYRKANAERISEYHKTIYVANKETIKARSKARYWEKIAPTRRRSGSRFASSEEAKEHYRLYKGAWYQANKERHRENGRKWLSEHREQDRLRCRLWARRNKESCAANGKKWREANREWVNSKARARYRNNPEEAKAFARNRRARVLAAVGSHTAADIRDIRRLQRDRCGMPYCKKGLRGKGHIDHIMPLMLGGGNHRRNLQLLCATCNMRKHAKDPLVFASENGLLV